MYTLEVTDSKFSTLDTMSLEAIKVHMYTVTASLFHLPLVSHTKA